MSQDRRRADLEAKKAKLAELKARKAERERNAAAQRGEASPGTPPRAGPSTDRKDLDQLLESLLPPSSPRSRTPLGSPSPITPSLAPSGFSLSGRNSRTSERLSERDGDGLIRPPSASRSGRVSQGSDTGSDIHGQGQVVVSSGVESDSERPSILAPIPIVAHNGRSISPSERTPTVSRITISHPPPPPPPSHPQRITYNREVQTVTFEEEPTGPSEDDIRHRIDVEVEAARAQRDKELEEENNKIAKEIEDEIRDLTEEERATIFTAPEFLEFVEQSSKIVQRALSDAYDYTRDYTLGADAEAVDYEGKRVKLVCAFYDERWCKNRSITDVDWSPKYPELTAASYNKNPAAINDPDGLVLVWNSHLVDRPEFVFHSQSDVLSVTFSPFHPNLLFGGTYSGQILLWDTRARHLPILKTPLSAAGHTYPVYAMSMVGTQNAHNLITTSTDGMVCSWLVDMLAQPQETLELQHSGHNKTNEVAITTFDFPDDETAAFWVGTEEGVVYQANRYDRAGSKAGLNQFDMYKGHNGPVTGLDFHPLHGPIDFSDFFLTSSVDWTVKLWKGKSVAKPSTSPEVVAPLYSFEEADDYVYDVRWHPVHPAMFGAVDGSGKFDLWNLNVDTEVPMVSTPIPSGRAINKLAWDRKDGKRAGLGCSDGKLYVYDIGDAAVPRESEWAEFQKALTGMTTGNSQNSLLVNTNGPTGGTGAGGGGGGGLLDREERPMTPTTNGRGFS